MKFISYNQLGSLVWVPCYSLGPDSIGACIRQFNSDKPVATTNHRLVRPMATPPKSPWQPNLDLANPKLAVAHPYPTTLYSDHFLYYTCPFIFLQHAQLPHCDHITTFLFSFILLYFSSIYIYFICFPLFPISLHSFLPLYFLPFYTLLFHFGMCNFFFLSAKVIYNHTYS